MATSAAFSSSLAVRSAVGTALAAVIAARGVRRRSLDASGGVAGFVVTAVHIACGYRYGAMLLAFFFTSSKITKIGEDRKRRIEEGFKEGGQRNWSGKPDISKIGRLLGKFIVFGKQLIPLEIYSPHCT
uniref:Uncharacterized protein n=1 Tax=Arundo donax TaxID=35708 RepID=A0A0A9BP18_ARUDO